MPQYELQLSDGGCELSMEKLITKQHVIDFLMEAQRIIAENKDYLTQLDSAIGDADHGINIDRGFSKIIAQLDGLKEKSIGEILKSCAMILISTVGGASGPLYGTAFLSAANETAGKEVLSVEDLLNVLKSALNGIKARGKATLSEKTMVDAIEPALQAFEKELLDGNRNLTKILEIVVKAAEDGAKNTIPLRATKGRASYLGNRSIGHQDPGATSSYLLFKAMYNVAVREG